mgnify:FL=1
MRIGDFNNDGYPDILLTVVNATAAPAEGGIFGASRSTGVQIKLLQNVECREKDKSDGEMCAMGRYDMARRKLEVVSGPVTDALLQIWDARDAAWVDVDENVSRRPLRLQMSLNPSKGTLDIMIMRSGKQDGQKVAFIKNNMFHDAFFLKALVLNGACSTVCEPADGGQRYDVRHWISPLWVTLTPL